MKKTYYITTPIYYPSGKWHLGSAYTTVLADAVARYKRMDGFDVFFLTGTDEHGQKIEKNAKQFNLSPKQFVDEVVEKLQNLWQVMDISYDKFIRTTDKEHILSVQKIFQTLYDKGEIYKSEYEGFYCTPCESFWTKTQSAEGKCPDCGRNVETAKEESYFFRLSKYSDRLLKLFNENPDFLQPKTRVNEMVNFIKEGLTDLAVSRTSFDWGIKVPFDDKHIIYVWFDALTNYITALGFFGDDDSLFQKYWPSDYQLMAKEIVRFHSIIWTSILMALEIPLPKHIYAHGWLLMGGDKLSKSKETTKVDVVDPLYLCGRYGSDAVRFMLAKNGPYAGDAPYVNETLLNCYNSDLCNDLGNLLSRTVAMATQYFGGQVSKPANLKSNTISEIVDGLKLKLDAAIDKCDLPQFIDEIFVLVRSANKYIDETLPWKLFKENRTEELQHIIYTLLEALRISAIFLKPLLTKKCPEIFKQIGASVLSFEKTGFGEETEYKTKKGEALFMRLDIEKEKLILEGIAKDDRGQENKKETEIASKEEQKAIGENKTEQSEFLKSEPISIADFAKIKLKAGKVIACEKVEKADKLLKLTVQNGDETRTIVSGIAMAYTAEQMVGKSVVFVENLAPAKFRGIESQGMILCAEDSKGNLCIVSPEKEVESGAVVR